MHTQLRKTTFKYKSIGLYFFMQFDLSVLKIATYRQINSYNYSNLDKHI